MQHFRFPLILTGIVLALALVVGVAGVTMFHFDSGSRRAKMRRAEQLGSGIATAACVIVAPFWFFAAAKVGKKRREARAAAKAREANAGSRGGA